MAHKMWILKYKNRPTMRFNDKQAMLEFLGKQSPVIQPHLSYEERRGIEPRKPIGSR